MEQIKILKRIEEKQWRESYGIDGNEQRTDSGFELFSHSAQKSHTFKVTEGGDEAKEKWLTTLQAAIDEVTPNEEGEISLETDSEIEF